MKITLLCSDAMHPVNSYLERWIAGVGNHLQVELVREKKFADGGDILFLVSCSEIIEKPERERYSACLVLHASDLPKGRGWSPHVWEIGAGAEFITLSLLEAEDKVDSGRVWKKIDLQVPKHALWNEINEILFQAELELIEFAISQFSDMKPESQQDDSDAIYYRRRNLEDSEIDPFKTIAEQFDTIRVCDPNRFPAYFELLGKRYLLKLEKSDD